MLFVLCHPKFSDAAAQTIEAFRERHEPQRAQLVRAHVTLVFDARSISPESLIEQTTAAAQTAAPFDITIDECRIHEDPANREYKLFLMVRQGREELTVLYRTLYGDRLNSERNAEIVFQPHITVATAATRAAIERAKAESSPLDLPIRGNIDALEVARLQEGRLTSLADERLSGDRSKRPS